MCSCLIKVGCPAAFVYKHSQLPEGDKVLRLCCKNHPTKPLFFLTSPLNHGTSGFSSVQQKDCEDCQANVISLFVGDLQNVRNYEHVNIKSKLDN